MRWLGEFNLVFSVAYILRSFAYIAYWTDMLICWEAYGEQQLGSESHGPGNA